MSKHHVSISVFLLLAFAAPCLAQDGSDGKPPVGAEGASSPKSAMKAINKAARVVGKFLEDPKGEAPIDQVAVLLKNAVDAKLAIPSLAAKQPEDKRAAFVLEYRLKMNDLIRSLLDLEEAMAAKAWDKANAAFAAAQDVKSAGHKKFKGRSRRGR